MAYSASLTMSELKKSHLTGLFTRAARPAGEPIFWKCRSLPEIYVKFKVDIHNNFFALICVGAAVLYGLTMLYFIHSYKQGSLLLNHVWVETHFIKFWNRNLTARESRIRTYPIRDWLSAAKCLRKFGLSSFAIPA